MSVSDFLKDLPIHNSENFTKLNSSDGYARSTASTTTSRQRATVYVPTVDHPSEQVIVTEHTNILLRFLHQQWDKKAANAQRKREADAAAAATISVDEPTGGPSARKKVRLDTLQTN